MSDRSVRTYQMDCRPGMKEHVRDGTVDLVVTDPPFALEAGNLDKHYARDESFVRPGYEDVPASKYLQFTLEWLAEVIRCLRPGGSVYIVSGWTHLGDILQAVEMLPLNPEKPEGRKGLTLRNHIVWKYNFGVHTTRKFITSHYHILYCTKPGGQVTFNTYCESGPQETTPNGNKRNYADREDVWVINREYKPGQRKNKNELPLALVQKMILYSSRVGNTVMDPFLGGFSTARVARGLGRNVIGFEKTEAAYDAWAYDLPGLMPGCLLDSIPRPKVVLPENQGEPWTAELRKDVVDYFRACRMADLKRTKKSIIEETCKVYGRGRFSIQRVLKEAGI